MFTHNVYIYIYIYIERERCTCTYIVDNKDWLLQARGQRELRIYCVF